MYNAESKFRKINIKSIRVLLAEVQYRRLHLTNLVSVLVMYMMSWHAYSLNGRQDDHIKILWSTYWNCILAEFVPYKVLWGLMHTLVVKIDRQLK